MVGQVVSLQSMEHHSGEDLHTTARGGNHTEAGGPGLKESVAFRDPPQELWGAAYRGAGDLGEAAAHGGLILEWVAPEGWTPWCGFMLEQFLGGCCLWRSQTGSIWEGRHLVEGTAY